MTRTALAALAAALTLTAALPSGEAAAHNAAWQSEGVAVDLAGNAYLIAIHYHGFCTNSFTVEVRNAATNALLQRRDFAGFQSLVDIVTGPYSEAFTATGGSLTPGVAFTYQGNQWWHLNGGPMEQVIRGTYQGLTFVAASVLEPWTFCN